MQIVFYTIYKTTNKINGKIYIGKHKTVDPNDDYLGSGTVFNEAKVKYGRENFMKEVLFIFDNEAEMDAKEAELVTEEFVLEDTNYNICPGGQGGWGYVNLSGFNRTEWHKENNSFHMKNMSKKGNEQKKILSETNPSWKENYLKKLSISQKKYIKEHGNQSLGTHHTEEWKQKHSAIMKGKAKGKNNSQFGSMWITNGNENRKIKNVDDIPEGWNKGRKIKSVNCSGIAQMVEQVTGSEKI